MENEAIRLGFVFDAKLRKWRHPSFRYYTATRAKYAVEDYPECVKAKAKEDAIRARQS